MRPILKWPGGKRRLLHEINQFLPSSYADRLYVEPFLGGGALFFELEPKGAILMDSNAALMRTYGLIKVAASKVIARLKTYESRIDGDSFYCIRQQYNERTCFGIEQAAQFIYLNKTCFNGLFRVNSEGVFNSSYGSYENPNICDEETILAAQQVLSHSSLYTGEFFAALQFCDGDEFVYLDPPYHTEGSNFTAYTKGGFSDTRQRQVAHVFRELAKKGSLVLASNSDTEFVRNLYADYNIHSVMAPRSISADGSVRKRVRELLISNY